MPDDTSTSRIPRRQRRTTEKSVEPAVPFEAPDSNDELAVSLEKVRRAR